MQFSLANCHGLPPKKHTDLLQEGIICNKSTVDLYEWTYSFILYFSQIPLLKLWGHMFIPLCYSYLMHIILMDIGMKYDL
jgi:hypothetical protein